MKSPEDGKERKGGGEGKHKIAARGQGIGKRKGVGGTKIGG